MNSKEQSRMLFINDQAVKKHGNNIIPFRVNSRILLSFSLLSPFFLFVQLALETGPQNIGISCACKVGFYPCFYPPPVSRKGLFYKLRKMTELRYIPEHSCSSNLASSAHTCHCFVYFFNSDCVNLRFF